ncbi:SDR family NAD(P)-dependent oxidoreductase [Streptococcus parauberis]|uniref:NADP-dependent 3-hydroxy acid dehydrogenase YdfG n=2 Tax=Streptococcus parauberis TaxID=1348 RepID=A0A0E2U9Z4_9STRE|nr:SDR family NAD(P)-dependent oxidoreductase [Streptococcus parauberis]AUT06000.1 2-deoxy-D-gluconate 3-dehydrogenase [Streptococcus parauberis]EMF49790.1 Short chain dehydrogenase [Streptococcus parauberis KRS-02109]EMG25954.1 Short chain dehydrogenase [Streptococcus parauberis KRS-02083]KYP16890.1 NADP-dependent 3-hydroxy acid dehydrogenase YdfG [Streptococcus parauberis]KYP18311.1 NADP-dependent 3-hydroxy acid dehydrogenase YdfG [Streptococcus parauberis]
MSNKVALVTGASAGFGKAIVTKLIEDGYRIIVAARRLEKLTELQTIFGQDKVYPVQMDITKTEMIDQVLKSLPEEWSQIDLLINNAGLAIGLDKAYEANFEDWMTMINTNIIGLTYLTRQILPQMVDRNSGMIINLGSTAGTIPYPGGNIYGATKAFVKQFSLNLRADLAGTKIRVTNIEPGLCEGTEFSSVRFNGDENRVDAVYQGANAIQPIDIANTVSWIVSQPEHVNINRIEIMPVSQSYGPQPVHRD